MQAYDPESGRHSLWYHLDEQAEDLDLAAEEAAGRLQWLPYHLDPEHWPPPPRLDRRREQQQREQQQVQQQQEAEEESQQRQQRQEEEQRQEEQPAGDRLEGEEEGMQLEGGEEPAGEQRRPGAGPGPMEDGEGGSPVPQLRQQEEGGGMARQEEEQGGEGEGEEERVPPAGPDERLQQHWEATQGAGSDDAGRGSALPGADAGSCEPGPNAGPESEPPKGRLVWEGGGGGNGPCQWAPGSHLEGGMPRWMLSTARNSSSSGVAVTAAGRQLWRAAAELPPGVQ